MNKVYIFVPLLLLAGFSFYYVGVKNAYDEAEAAKEAAVKQARIDEMKQEAEDRKAAIEAALALNAERKAEREAKEAEELAKKEARLAAEEARNDAQSARSKFSSQVKTLEQDIAAVEAEIEEIKTEKEALVAEEAHLRTYVAAAEKNKASLQDVIRKINEADTARAAAAAAAAAAARR
ncbi:hypothetical protein [Actomonas aquatica]|uniref:Uncharacterized protein n=1 Tax=Actomonas aquatica TaxID=2866162 RepID=A0ABZ1C7U9_9BACT|nr:hypothetical protein [Opitutus sp. WL0086]WRQ87664.1 hypothetical protein K1X11_022855 [Opitutus sp. WL0086]